MKPKLAADAGFKKPTLDPLETTLRLINSRRQIALGGLTVEDVRQLARVLTSVKREKFAKTTKKTTSKERLSLLLFKV